MSSNTTTKTLRVATWEYETPEGVRRRAYFGDVIEVTDDELKRGKKEGAFDQPKAGPQPTPFLATGVTAKNLKAALGDFESMAPAPLGDDGTAVLHHDIRPPEVEPADVAVAPQPEPADGAPSISSAESPVPDLSQPQPNPVEPVGPAKPLKAAPKAEWEAYTVAVTAGTDNPVTAEDAKALHKTDLIELYG